MQEVVSVMEALVEEVLMIVPQIGMKKIRYMDNGAPMNLLFARLFNYACPTIVPLILYCRRAALSRVTLVPCIAKWKYNLLHLFGQRLAVNSALVHDFQRHALSLILGIHQLLNRLMKVSSKNDF